MLISDPPLPGTYQPRRGGFCLSRFTADDQWYRARIEKVESLDKVHVAYIDYGNVSRFVVECLSYSLAHELFSNVKPRRFCLRMHSNYQAWTT